MTIGNKNEEQLVILIRKNFKRCLIFKEFILSHSTYLRKSKIYASTKKKIFAPIRYPILLYMSGRYYKISLSVLYLIYLHYQLTKSD